MPDRHYLQGRNKPVPPEILRGGVIFDANVWLTLNGPFPDNVVQRAAAYSSFYKKLVESGGQVLLPQVVACEFVNRAIWMQAGAEGFVRGAGKIHQARDFPRWAKESCDLLNAIVTDCERVSDRFDQIEMEEIFSITEAGGLDFNDVLILDLCRELAVPLVTDDADYAGQNLSIITFNTRIT